MPLAALPLIVEASHSPPCGPAMCLRFKWCAIRRGDLPAANSAEDPAHDAGLGIVDLAAAKDRFAVRIVLASHIISKTRIVPGARPLSGSDRLAAMHSRRRGRGRCRHADIASPRARSGRGRAESDPRSRRRATAPSCSGHRSRCAWCLLFESPRFPCRLLLELIQRGVMGAGCFEAGARL